MRKITLACVALVALLAIIPGVASAKPLHCKKGHHNRFGECVANPKPKRGPRGLPGATGAAGTTGAAGGLGPAGNTGAAGSPAPTVTFDTAWGQLTRNEFGSPTAVLGQHSPEADGDGSLILATSGPEEKAEFATTEFEGLPVANISSLTYEAFVTDGDYAISPENGINVQIEVDPHLGGKSYSSLVYNPGPITAVDGWATIDTVGPQTGLGGWYFTNGAVAEATHCGQAGGEHFCTLAEVQNAAPEAEVSLSLGLGKGRDHEFQGAADNLVLNGCDFDFTSAGVVVK